MQKVLVWVEDISDDSDLELFLPCDLSFLDPTHEYLIADSTHDLGETCSLQVLNSALRQIEDCCPDVTLEWIEALLEASLCDSVADPEFLERIASEDYFITDLSGLTWNMGDEACAACFLATELFIPFAAEITPDTLRTIRDELIDYISWDDIWYGNYEFMNFKLVHSGDSLYIVQWV